jgi:hypothetical protein
MQSLLELHCTHEPPSAAQAPAGLPQSGPRGHCRSQPTPANPALQSQTGAALTGHGRDGSL